MFGNALRLAAVLLLCPLLFGCGGPAPEETAKTALEATIRGDFATAFEHFCAAMKEDMPPQEIIDEISKELRQYEFDFSGLTYEVVESSESAATIRVSGTILGKGPDKDKTEEMDEIIMLIMEDDVWKVCE